MSQAEGQQFELVISIRDYHLHVINMQNINAPFNLAAHTLKPGIYPVQRISAPIEHADCSGDWLVLLDSPTGDIIGAPEAELAGEKASFLKHHILEPWVTVREVKSVSV